MIGETDVTHTMDREWLARNPRGRVTIAASDLQPCQKCGLPIEQASTGGSCLSMRAHGVIVEGVIRWAHPICSVQLAGDSHIEIAKQYNKAQRQLIEQAKQANARVIAARTLQPEN